MQAKLITFATVVATTTSILVAAVPSSVLMKRQMYQDYYGQIREEALPSGSVTACGQTIDDGSNVEGAAVPDFIYNNIDSCNNKCVTVKWNDNGNVHVLASGVPIIDHCAGGQACGDSRFNKGILLAPATWRRVASASDKQRGYAELTWQVTDC